jgi:hypothetical protein
MTGFGPTWVACGATRAANQSAAGERAIRLRRSRPKRGAPARLPRRAVATTCRLSGSGAGRGSSSTAATTPVPSAAASTARRISESSVSTSSTRATGRGGRTACSCSSAGDLRRRPDGLPLLKAESLLSRATVARGGVQVGPEQARVGRAAGALQATEELIARGVELKRSVDGDLGVRHGPTHLPDTFLDSGEGSSEDLEGLTLLAKGDKGVGNGSEVGGGSVESACLTFPTSRHPPRL